MAADAFALNSRLVHLWLAAMQLSTTLKSVSLLTGSTKHPRGEQGESHTSTTLIACLQGVVRIESSNKQYDLQAGEAVIIAPGAWHRHVMLRPGSASIGQGFMLGRSDIELSVPEQTWWMTIPEQPSRSLLESACASNARERLALLCKLFMCLADESAQVVKPMPAAVQKMWLYMRRERLAPIKAADVLRASGLKPTRAHIVFTHYFAETPHQLLKRHRLEYASHLLSAGKAIGLVATQCGFRTRRQFTAAFTAAFAYSPRAWQNRTRTEIPS